jgi:threonyl-tRNA synthetase
MIDHRRLGRELELFHSDPLIGAGLPIWLPAGAAARHEIEEYLREEERLAGYQHVYSPPIAKQEMYARSGHLANFADDMFPPMVEEGAEPLMLRPSMCPHHAMVFAARGRSYRELPLRVAELGGQYRSERSGVLGGLTRVRSIWLNDAHVYCALDQVGDEVARVLDMIHRAHAALGFAADSYRLSLRGDLSGKYLGSAERWDEAEGLLRSALRVAGVPFYEAAGEGAFYGPKIDIQVRDSQDREFTISTIQVDFAQAELFDLHYTAADGSKARPVVIHRSLVGSLERVFAHLIEVHQGAFPVWYAPVQLMALPVSESAHDAALGLVDGAMRAGLRAESILDGSLGARIREASRRKVPYVAVIGEREAANGEVSLRLRGGRQLDPMPVPAVMELISSVVRARTIDLLP